jgi:hypothetical protein
MSERVLKMFDSVEVLRCEDEDVEEGGIEGSRESSTLSRALPTFFFIRETVADTAG